MTPEEKLRGIESWRGMEMLTPFFGISCACEGLEETTFGEIVDFLLSSLREKERELKAAAVRYHRECEEHDKQENLSLKRAEAAELQLSSLIERAAQLAELMKSANFELFRSNSHVNTDYDMGRITVVLPRFKAGQLINTIKQLGKEGK